MVATLPIELDPAKAIYDRQLPARQPWYLE